MSGFCSLIANFLIATTKHYKHDICMVLVFNPNVVLAMCHEMLGIGF